MKPWRPGELVEGESAVQDILNAVAFVRQDPSSSPRSAKSWQCATARRLTTLRSTPAWSSARW